MRSGHSAFLAGGLSMPSRV